MTTQNTELLEQQVEQTKSNIVHSLEIVENKVRDKVDEVRDKVEEVKHTLDLKSKVVEHPLAAVGGSVLTGLVLGALVSGGRSSDAYESDSYEESALPVRKATRSSNGGGFAHWVKNIAHEFDDEIKMAKGMAVGALLGNVMKFAEEKAPQFSPYIRPLVDSVKGKNAYTVDVNVHGDRSDA